MKRFRVAMAAGLCAVAASTVSLLAAGNYSMYPLVGGAAICAGTVTGSSTFGGNTGQGQATNGSICPLSVPAGPTVVTGTELIPADTALTGGAPPQTVVLSLGSLNALPITFSNLDKTTATNVLTATNITGGFFTVSAASLSPTTVVLPPTPIDRQQFVFSSNATIATLSISPVSGQSISQPPTVLTVSTTGDYGYRFVYRAADTFWYRLQ